MVTICTASELKKSGLLKVNGVTYVFDDVGGYYFDYDKRDKYGEPTATFASSIHLVDEEAANYCTAEIDEDGYVSDFYYNFDSDGNPGGDDIPFDPEEIIKIYARYDH